MAKLIPLDSQPQRGGDNSPPDPVQIVLAAIYDWARIRSHHGPLPAPCPPVYADAARWWISCMSEPEQPGETRQIAVVGGTLRWECGHALRCRNALLRWLDMPAVQREAIVAIVLEDGIPYRGDSFRDYTEIVEESLRMRDGRDAYIAEARHLLRAAIGRLAG